MSTRILYSVIVSVFFKLPNCVLFLLLFNGVSRFVCFEFSRLMMGRFFFVQLIVQQHSGSSAFAALGPKCHPN